MVENTSETSKSNVRTKRTYASRLYFVCSLSGVMVAPSAPTPAVVSLLTKKLRSATLPPGTADKDAYWMAYTPPKPGWPGPSAGASRAVLALVNRGDRAALISGDATRCIISNAPNRNAQSKREISFSGYVNIDKKRVELVPWLYTLLIEQVSAFRGQMFVCCPENERCITPAHWCCKTTARKATSVHQAKLERLQAEQRAQDEAHPQLRALRSLPVLVAAVDPRFAMKRGIATGLRAQSHFRTPAAYDLAWGAELTDAPSCAAMLEDDVRRGYFLVDHDAFESVAEAVEGYARCTRECQIPCSLAPRCAPKTPRRLTPHERAHPLSRRGSRRRRG